MTITSVPVDSVRYVKDLYPRLQPDDATIDAYRMAIDNLPPIVVARDGILVDGYHRWQAHIREGLGFVDAENLGDLSDDEIFWQSVERNAHHGKQLSIADKRNIATQRYAKLQPKGAIKELAERLKVDQRSVERWTKDARAAQAAQRQADAYDLWLDCLTHEQIADELDVKRQTVSDWLAGKRQLSETGKPPGATDEKPWGSVQHFDVWNVGTTGGDSGYFGRLPPMVVENLLWLYTDPGQTLVDPFTGSGTSVKVAKRMGRRVWASDLQGDRWDKTLPIHQHDITTGWPDGAPKRADLLLLDPPYWKQAAGRYSDDPADLGNMPLTEFLDAWEATVKACSEHLDEDGRLAYIVSPAEDDGRVVDLATEMLRGCWDAGLTVERRIIVPYSSQQASGAEVEAFRVQRRLLKLYRDLVVLR